MKGLWIWLKLLRLENMLITMSAQWIFYHYLLIRTFEHFGLQLRFSVGWMLELILCTALALGAGNIYNDICDVKADAYNRPDRFRYIGHFVSTRSARSIYGLLTLMAIGLSLHLAIILTNPIIPLIVLTSVVLLFAYSRYWQYLPAIGNMTVALLCALAIIILPLAAIEDLHRLQEMDPSAYKQVVKYFLFFSTFAFLATWMRELVKDMHDIEGDKHVHSKTLPIILPRKKIKIMGSILLLSMAVILTLMLILNNQFLAPMGLKYYYSLIASSALILIFFYRSKSKVDLARISLWLKFYLVQGILFVVFWHASV